MGTTAYRVLAALSLAAVTSLPGCIDADGEADTGTVNINLVGQGTSGAVYRLRDATFTVDGPAPTVWHTEDDPDRTTLSADVPVGAYNATLATGWRLERLAPGAPPVTVMATLTSANPLAFAVSPMMRTSVPFRFAAGGDVVDMTQGYDITIGVDDLGTNIIATPGMLSINEGALGTLTVRLATAPTVPVTVSVVSSDTSAAVVMPSTLTFTPANYNVAQIVNVMGVQDADTTGEAVQVALSAAGLPTAVVTVLVNDDDVPPMQSIVTTVNALSLVEGSTAAVGVRLAAPPPGVVTLQVVSTDPSAVVTSPSTITFTPANFNTTQIVIVNAVQDPDNANEMVLLQLIAPGVPVAVVSVVVSDDD